MKGPETRIRKKIQKALAEEYPGCLLLKIHGSPFQDVGIPDLICCIRGRFIGIEVKQPRKKGSLVQLVMIKRIIMAGGYGFVCDNVQSALDGVKNILYQSSEI